MTANNSPQKAPVLFIIFNRKDRALESFQPIKRYRPNKLYIAADGPRDNKTNETELCKTTRNAILEEINWDCEVHTLFREKNVGCGRGVSEAISWMFETEEYGIINEDDCLACDDFFLFCEELLPRYKNDEQIAQINGFDMKYAGKSSNTYFFTSYPEIWGWATWKRAWVNIDFKMNEFPRIKKMIWKRFCFKEALIHYYLWNRLYKHIQKGEKIYAWGFQWSIYVFMQNKLCINPKANLVINTGFGSGTNCKNSDTPLASAKHGSLKFPLVHPTAIEINSENERIRSKEYISVYKSVLLSKIKRIIKNIFRKK